MAKSFSNFAVIADMIFTGKNWLNRSIILVENGLVIDILEFPPRFSVFFI